MSKKRKNPQADGLGPREKEQIRKALRQVWSWSLARKLVVKRCTREDGFLECEECRERVPKVQVDHLTPCGEVDDGFIRRLFVQSHFMRGLCKKCHDIKTKLERINQECF